MNDAWFEAMRGFYRELDGELAGLAAACAGCGRCCHFDEVEHILYASRLERLYLARVAAAPARPDAAPELLASGKRCPFQKNRACLAREGRVLGCRLHFCAREDDELSARWHDRLKRLHEELGVEWEYGPLLPLGEG